MTGGSLTIAFRRVEDLRPHPAAGQIPINQEDALALAEDIKHHGILHPLDITPDGRILDGVTRWQIAKELGIKEVRVLVFVYEDPLEEEAHCIRTNIPRRHLSLPERLRWANRLVEIYRELAARRKAAGQRAGGATRAAEAARTAIGTFAPQTPGERSGTEQEVLTKHPNSSLVDTVSPKLEGLPEKAWERKAIARVAREVGVSPTTLKQARSAIRANPELEEPLYSGKITVKEAYREAKGRAKLPAFPRLVTWTYYAWQSLISRLFDWLDQWAQALARLASPANEARVFCRANTQQTRVNPNLILWADPDSPGAAAIRALHTDPTSPLSGRIDFQQRREGGTRGKVLARTVLYTALLLEQGLAISSAFHDLPTGLRELDRLLERHPSLPDNLRALFGFLGEVWGWDGPHLRQLAVWAVAAWFHGEQGTRLWRRGRLRLRADDQRKMATFSWLRPQVGFWLLGGNGVSRLEVVERLAELLHRHYWRGKRAEARRAA